MVYKHKQAAKQFAEKLHWSSPLSRFGNKIIGQTANGVNQDFKYSWLGFGEKILATRPYDSRKPAQSGP
jgi:hypothetical protein